ncbi:spore coat protein [Clostridium hydrogenum]|uniref:spore coat protein n=1 Tax=Clostridium hydrogenum TaxID=2855764 RepID=UPI001F1F32D3|nr:spore coat protein [Clostridium hydrogenum]
MNTTTNLSEKEIMQDLLATEKQTISAYSTGITESSCENLRNTLLNNFKSSEEVQYKIFDSMKQKGWYPTKDAPDSDVQQVKNDACSMAKELC